ncbi:MAG: phasin family protein, partial [Pararhizobium sp.]
TKTLEATFESAQAGTVDLGLKAIGMMRVNADNSLSHLEALLGVKSLAELLELQTTFVRKQVEVGVDQVKVLQEASRKIAEDVAKPVRAAADKAAGESKAA